MASIPKKVIDRFKKAVPKFQKILQDARDRDVNESETVRIVTDILSELFGYDRYSEVTTELDVKGTYCDIAIRVDNDLRFIIEVKAIGHDLKDKYVRQAVDYATNKGVDWAILTNGILWRVFHVTFGKPIGQELILELNFLELNPRSSNDANSLYLLARGGLNKSLLAGYQTQVQATNKYMLSAIIMTEPVLNAIRREVRRISPDVGVKIEDIKEALAKEVLKREVVEGEKAVEASKKVNKATRKKQKAVSKRETKQKTEPETQTPAPQPILPHPSSESNMKFEEE